MQEADLLGQLGGENFEGGLLAGKFFLRKIDAAHAAAAEFLEDDPFAQAIADHADESRSCESTSLSYQANSRLRWD